MTSKSAFKKELEIIHSDLIKINDWMYENPELAFEEFKTCLLYTSDAADES